MFRIRIFSARPKNEPRFNFETLQSIMKKKDFLLKDRIIKGITDDGFFKVSVVKTTDVVKAAQQKHGLSLLSAVLLGRTLTGCMLLASELKGEEHIRLWLEGNGPVGIIAAEANSAGEIRGYVKNPLAELDYKSSNTLGDGIGLGVLSVSKTLYNEARPTTGSVEIVKGNISEDLAHYLIQSEQVQSAIHLDVGIDENGLITSAGGVLIQALPGAPTDKIDKIQANFTSMPPVAEQFNTGNYIDDILQEIAAPYTVRELDRYPVHFFCRCSKDRFKDALQLIGVDDLTEISDKGQELVCHYCNEKYVITKEEIVEMLNDSRAKLN
jgi:molecular chaperone Hsp33